MKRNCPSVDRPAVCSACGYRAATVAVAYCPGCGETFVPVRAPQRRSRLGWFSLPPMLFPRPYRWFVYASALDVVLTWVILLLGGSEVNVIADAVIAFSGLKGILIYKFCLVVLVVIICEIVGRRRPWVGRNLARTAVVITASPVVLSILQLVSS